jgi:hypothetical protein
MNNKITSNSTSLIQKVTPSVIKFDNNYEGLNDEIINNSHFNNYKGLDQAKVLRKEEYNPFKHQMGKD